MRRLALVSLALVLVVGLAFAGQSEKGAPAKTHKANVEVVSVDTTANTITFKGEDGKEMTAPAEGKAAESLKNLKAGDKVTATCRDNDKGEHQALVDIQAAPAPAKKEKPKN